MRHQEAAGARPSPRVRARMDDTDDTETAGASDGAEARSSPRARAARAARLLLLVAVAILGPVAAVMFLGPLLVRQVVRLLNLSVQGFVWIVGGLEQGLDAWSLAAEIARAIGAGLATPEVGAAIVVVEIVGVAALYALHRLLANEKGVRRQ